MPVVLVLITLLSYRLSPVSVPIARLSGLIVPVASLLFFDSPKQSDSVVRCAI
jgi:hypothetical protein